MNKTIALAFAVSTLFLAGCSTTPRTTTWEYKTLQTWPGNDLELNKMVSNGWKLDSFSVGEDVNKSPIAYYLMKRPKQ